MTDEERRKKFSEIVNRELSTSAPMTRERYVDYMDESGSTQIKPTEPQTLTPSAYKNRYGHVLKSQAYMNLSNDDKKMIQLNNQVNAYKKAKDAFDKISYSERGSTSKKSDSWQKSKTLVDNLEKELQTQYKSIFGVDADFKKWLGSAVLQGANQFNLGLANTGAMVGNLIPSAINEAYRHLNYGTDIGSTAQLRTADELEKVKGSLLYGTLMGGWVNQYEKAIGKPDEEMRGWLSSYEKLTRRANELSAKGNNNEADIYNSRAQEFYDRISKKYEDYLKRTGNFWLIAEGEDLFSQHAEIVNDVYAREQENYQKQLEYQKMTASGSGKGHEIAGQFIQSAVAALPYAGLALMTGGASIGAEAGAQIAPRTVSTLDKVANALTSYGKDPQYWLSFAQEAGNTYKEAVDAGADQNVATLTAVLVGLINGAIEIGIPGESMGGIQGLPERLFKEGADSSRWKIVKDFIEAGLGEGKEEVIQGLISNLAEKLAYNQDKKWFGEGGVIDPQALGQEGLMGMGVGFLLGGGQIMGVNAVNQSIQNRVDQANAKLGQRYSEQADTIIQNARQMGPETQSYQLASDILEKGSHTDADIGALYRAYMSDTGYNQSLRANTIQAVQQRLTELGETSDTREIAEIIAKQADGQKLTKAETRAIENSKYGQRVLNEYFTAGRGVTSSAWAENLNKRSFETRVQSAPELTPEQKTERIEQARSTEQQAVTDAELPKTIETMAARYGAEANVFKEAVKSSTPEDIYEFNTAYETVYQLAKAGVAEATAMEAMQRNSARSDGYRLSNQQFKLAYESGVRAGVRANENAPKGTRFKKGAVHINGINYEKLNGKQKASVRVLMKLAEATGVDVELFQSTTDENGNYTGYQGKYEDGKIYIDINAGLMSESETGNLASYAMLRTASHEFTHYLQRNATKEYAALKQAVFSNLQRFSEDGKYRTADEWIGAVMEQTGRDYDYCSNECVARACEMMLRDSTAFETLAKENRNLAQRFIDWLKEFIADIKAAFEGVVENRLEAKAMLDDLEHIQKLWDEAMVAAVRNTKQNAESGTQSEAQFEERIRNAVDEAIQNKGKLNEPYNQAQVAAVPTTVANMVLAASGGKIDIREKIVAVGGSETYHEYIRHSDPDTERDRGQIALTPQTMTDAISAIYNPDLVESIYTTQRNKYQRQTFAYAKKIDTNYIVVEAVGGKRNPNIVPVMVFNFTDKKWNAWLATGKSIAELIYENDPDALASVESIEDNKNNRVTAAVFAPRKGGTLTPRSPRLSANNIAEQTGDVNIQNEEGQLEERPALQRDAEYLKLAKDPEKNEAELAKMVEQAARAAGYDYHLYHGSRAGGGFTVFKNWQYFTENRAYAERYQQRDNPGSMYEVYAKSERMFDTRNDEAREIFEQYRGEYGMGELQDSGLPDWTDGYDISDIIEENDLDYDGIVLDEGGDMVDGKPVKRGVSYVLRASEQVKSADPVTYDDNGNVVPLSERFNPENEDIRYEERMDADTDEATEGPVRQKSSPYYAKSDLRKDMLNLFSIPSGMRAEMGTLVDQYADKMLAEGKLTQEDYDELIDALYKKGVMSYPALPVMADARKLLASKRVYVPERIKPEFGDDWNAFRKRAFAAGLYLTSNESDPAPDVWNISLSRELPGFFQESETDDREILERMVELAEEGKDKKMSLAEYTAQLAKEGFIDEEQFNYDLERKVQQALEKFAEKARIEITMRGRAERLMDRQRALLDRYKRRRETTAVRNKIKNLMEKWNSKLLANTPNKNIPAQFAQAVSELSQALDLTSGRPLSEKAQDKLTKLKAAYDSIMADKNFADLADPVAKQLVDNAVDAINNTPLRQMDKEHLDALYDAMKALNKVIFEANRLRSKAYNQDRYATGKAMIVETNEAMAPKWEFWRDYETWQLTPDRFFAMLGGWKKNSVWETQVAESFKEGTRRALRVERDFYNTFKAFTEAPEMDRLVNTNKLIDVGLLGKDGKSVKLTRGMALSLYMHLLADDNRRAILYGGLNVPEFDKYYGGNVKGSYAEGRDNAVGILTKMTAFADEIYEVKANDSLTDEQKEAEYERIGQEQDQLESEGYDMLDALKNRIYDQMTDFEKKLCETVAAWNDGKSRDYINEVTMEMYGIKRAKVNNYYRIHRDTAFVQTDFESISKNINLTNADFLKDRVKSAAPVLLTDITYEMDNGVKQLATYYGYVKAQTDFTKLFNVRLHGQNVSVKGAVLSKFGEGKKTFGVTADQYVENFIDDVVGSRLKPDTTVLAVIRRNLPRAALTLNPRVALSQIASVPTAAAEVGWGPMFKGFFRGFPKAFSKSYKEDLMQRDEYFFQRYRGDGAMREFADMKSGNNIIDKLWNKADKLTRHALLNWCQNCDVFATTTMWAMAEEWVKDNTNLTGEEFDAAVKEKYDDIITKTQPNYTTTERSDLLRDTREQYKFLTMYKTQSNQNFNILKEANARLRKTASDFKNHKNGVTQEDLKAARKQFANAYTAVFFGGTVAFVLLRAVANALLGHMNDYRDDDDEITAVSMLNGVTIACVQSLSGMFALGSEFEALVEKSITGKKYYGLEDTALASVNNVVKQAWALAVAYTQGETDGVGKKWAKLMQNGAQIVGIPYGPGKTWYEAVRTWANDIERGTFGSFEGGVTRTNSVNYNRLYKALENGDTAKADRIREEIRRNDPDIEDKTIESGLRGVIKGMWEDGFITTAEAVDELVEYTGKDPDTAYWDVQKWANKANAGEDEEYTNSDYYRLWQVIDSDGDAEAAMSELLEHGKDADQIAQDVREHIKDAYTNGEITDAQARERLLKYGQHKENKQLVKYTKAEADKLVNGWVTSNTLGWDYDDKETLYAKGEISKSELKTALVDIGGMTSEKADQRIEIMDWDKEGYAVENDKYDSIIGEYNKKLKSHGISKSIWYNYYVFKSKTSGEVDANGKSIPYSKMKKLFEYIGKLNITNDQKMALARTYTDSESSIEKYKTW